MWGAYFGAPNCNSRHLIGIGTVQIPWFEAFLYGPVFKDLVEPVCKDVASFLFCLISCHVGWLREVRFSYAD